MTLDNFRARFAASITLLLADCLKDSHGGSFGDYFTESICPPRCCVALSGGVDSMCLAWAMMDFYQNKNWPLEDLHLVHVDHGLRSNSGQQARELSCLVRQHFSMSLTTLLWKGHKPTTRVQEKARAARYDLLGTHCKENNLSFLLTAHHGDDALETVLMRLQRGEEVYCGSKNATLAKRGLRGFRGMGGINPSRRTSFGHVLRPLLSFAKSELIEVMLGLSIPWIEDPSNAKDVFERNRVRRDLHAVGLSSTPSVINVLTKGFSLIRQADAALDHMTQFFLHHHYRPQILAHTASDTASKLALEPTLLGIGWGIVHNLKDLVQTKGLTSRTEAGAFEIFCRLIDALPEKFFCLPGQGTAPNHDLPPRYPPRGRGYGHCWSMLLAHKPFTWQGLYLVPAQGKLQIFRDPRWCPYVVVSPSLPNPILWDGRFTVEIPTSGDEEDIPPRTYSKASGDVPVELNVGPLSQRIWQKVKDQDTWRRWLAGFASVEMQENQKGKHDTELSPLPGPAIYTLPALLLHQKRQDGKPEVLPYRPCTLRSPRQ